MKSGIRDQVPSLPGQAADSESVGLLIRIPAFLAGINGSADQKQGDVMMTEKKLPVHVITGSFFCADAVWIHDRF